MWWMLFPRWIWFPVCILIMMDHRVCAMPRVADSHAGICPNEMNPNLWVDAMSTCTRECDSDQECDPSEKCCPNVCGTQSCVAARHAGQKTPAGTPREATCASFPCTQQGSQCALWDGQPMCRCRDRCEREPHFTCASDGMTYYNRCYLDAEACSKGTTLSVVACRFHLTWLNTSPALPRDTTLQPTTPPLWATVPPPANPQPPVMVSSPAHQSVRADDTASFVCEVAGSPAPEITWEKQEEVGVARVAMRPNHVRGNMVVTNVGQLVIHNAQPRDSGIYICTARNPSGWAQSRHPLTVLPAQPPSTPPARNQNRCLPGACGKPPDSGRDCGESQETVGWRYEAESDSCLSSRRCHGNSSQPGPEAWWDTYEECVRCCAGALWGPCGLPSLQGPCKAYELRWAYSGALHHCHSFIYGGCGSNGNNFASKEACEETCPRPRTQRCRACRPRGKMVTSFCRSDFVVLGHMTELTEEADSGHALLTVEEILKDDKMGLRFLGQEPLEVTFLNMDWSCPCPNITGAAAEGQVIVMGDVSNGMAVLRPESFVGASSPRRVRKLREVISKNTCDILKDITSSPQ